MNKTFLVVILLIVLVSGGLFLSQRGKLSSPTKSNATKTESTVSNHNDSSTGQTDAATVQGLKDARYLDYSPAAFDLRRNDRRVLYFHAPWCPICRPLDKALSSNPNQIPEGVVLFKTDYDTETALKTKYGITYQHTFVEVDAAGNAVQIWNGGDVADIVAKLQ